MCGIAGLVRLDLGLLEETEVEALSRMQQALVHRGPDSGGSLVDRWIGLTMRRLKVIDLDGGDQPISTPDGRFQIVFNGEIYNYRELRTELLGKGHCFGTGSDTEVLLHMYQEHGLAALERLNGMFAFAIWDREHEELVLGRDRMGIKPLLYAVQGPRLVFASEAGGLHASGLVDREVDLELLPALLLMQYVPSPRTIHRGVMRLPPGSVLRVDRSGWRIEELVAATMISEPDGKAGAAPGRDRHALEGAADRVLAALRTSIGYRMIADVPVGSFLSGGIDSSLVTALMAERASGRLKTFSVGMEGDPSFDELSHARTVAELLGTDHYELVFSSDDLASLLAAVLERLDDPILDPALLPTYAVSKLAREQVTVVLSGEGADELFGGYRRYRLQHLLGRWPGWLWRLVPTMGRHRWRQASDALQQRDPLESHLRWCATTAGSVAVELLAPDLVHASGEYVRQCFERLASPGGRTRTPVELAMELDQRSWLIDDLLVKVDRMSMAHGLEARVPYLDRSLVELARSLPLELKLTTRRGKLVLRHAARGLVPEQIVSRPKQGFDLPLGLWFRGRLRELAMDHLELLRRERVVDHSALASLVERHMSGRDDLGLLIFSLVVISMLLSAQSCRGRLSPPS